MLMLKSAFLQGEEGLKGKVDEGMKYWIDEVDDPTFFPGHAAAVHLRVMGKEALIGVFGILHPTVLEAFDLKYRGVASALEINIEPFL